MKCFCKKLAAIGGDGPRTPGGRRRICGRLPLALGMAGKLIKSLELDGDWTDVSGILMDELSEGMSSEQRVIRASLAGLKCSSKDKEGVNNLFKLFGLVPEGESLYSRVQIFLCLLAEVRA